MKSLKLSGITRNPWFHIFPVTYIVYRLAQRDQTLDLNCWDLDPCIFTILALCCFLRIGCMLLIHTLGGYLSGSRECMLSMHPIVGLLGACFPCTWLLVIWGAFFPFTQLLDFSVGIESVCFPCIRLLVIWGAYFPCTRLLVIWGTVHAFHASDCWSSGCMLSMHPNVGLLGCILSMHSVVGLLSGGRECMLFMHSVVGYLSF